MQEWAKQFYTSTEWKKCRKSYIERRIAIDGGLCEECRNNLGYIVHHKIPLTPYNINDINISLNHNNLAYVCKHCHDRFEGHWTSRKTEVVCVFNEDGQVIDRPYSPLSR